MSWNINGIRASKTDLKALFESLDGDVICLQETKVTRKLYEFSDRTGFRTRHNGICFAPQTVVR